MDFNTTLNCPLLFSCVHNPVMSYNRWLACWSTSFYHCKVMSWVKVSLFRTLFLLLGRLGSWYMLVLFLKSITLSHSHIHFRIYIPKTWVNRGRTYFIVSICQSALISIMVSSGPYLKTMSFPLFAGCISRLKTDVPETLIQPFISERAWSLIQDREHSNLLAPTAAWF